jgi:DNA-binding CsgD family transcriptional regulator
VVTGPAGVGKSRLVREAVADTPVAWAMGSPVAPVPFGVVRELVTVEEWNDHARTVRSYVSALQRSAHRVIVVEDLHWADADSLAVLVDLARRPDGPVLLATTRDEPHRSLVDMLALLSSTPDATTLTLAGLSTGGVAELIESVWHARVPMRTAMQVRRRTDGLPYWLEELARTAGTPDELTSAALPGMAGAALRARVDAAGSDAVRVAEVAAVLDERIDLQLLSQVLDEPVETLLAMLRRLVDARVLVQTGPDRFAFRHALTREAVADRVPDAAHRRWHEKAYAVRHAAGAPHAVLAQHAAGAGMTDETIGSALRAAQALLAAGSGAEALRMAELALDAGAHPAGPVHALAARAAYAAGWFDEAEAHARAWREQSDGEAAADAHCLLGSLRWSAGDLAGQRRELQAALAVLRDHARTGESSLLARVHAALARSLVRAEQDDEAIAEADRALAIAERAGEPEAWRDALTTKGTAVCHRAKWIGDPAGHTAGLTLLAEAEVACEQSGDLLALGRVLNNGLEYRMAGRPTAERWAIWEATWQRVTRWGPHPALGRIVFQAVDLAYTTGQWERGWQIVNARLPEETEPVDRVVLAAKAALLALEADRIDDAVRLVERSTAEAAGMDQFWVVLYVAVVDVALTARTAPAASTVRALGRYRRSVALTDHARRPNRALEAARWALDGGISPSAVRGFLAATLPGGLPQWLTSETDLMLAHACADDARAVRAGQQALKQHDARPLNAVLRADTITRLGRSLLRTGQIAQARELADEACTLLAAWPGRRLAAAQALRQAAAGAEPALTCREREVRDMVAEGLSNRAIGDRLGISPRTVAVHVSRLLAKAGATSRTELAVRHVRRTG